MIQAGFEGHSCYQLVDLNFGGDENVGFRLLGTANGALADSSFEDLVDHLDQLLVLRCVAHQPVFDVLVGFFGGAAVTEVGLVSVDDRSIFVQFRVKLILVAIVVLDPLKPHFQLLLRFLFASVLLDVLCAGKLKQEMNLEFLEEGLDEFFVLAAVKVEILEFHFEKFGILVSRTRIEVLEGLGFGSDHVGQKLVSDFRLLEQVVRQGGHLESCLFDCSHFVSKYLDHIELL